MLRRTRFSTRSACAGVVSGSAMRNSSPPQRANTSSCRSDAPAAAAKRCNNASPAVCPLVSLYALKLSRSITAMVIGLPRKRTSAAKDSTRVSQTRRLYRPVRGSVEADCINAVCAATAALTSRSSIWTVATPEWLNAVALISTMISEPSTRRSTPRRARNAGPPAMTWLNIDWTARRAPAGTRFKTGCDSISPALSAPHSAIASGFTYTNFPCASTTITAAWDRSTKLRHRFSASACAARAAASSVTSVETPPVPITSPLSSNSGNFVER